MFHWLVPNSLEVRIMRHTMVRCCVEALGSSWFILCSFCLSLVVIFLCDNRRPLRQCNNLCKLAQLFLEERGHIRRTRGCIFPLLTVISYSFAKQMTRLTACLFRGLKITLNYQVLTRIHQSIKCG